MNIRNIVTLIAILALLAAGLWYSRASRRGQDMLTPDSLASFVSPGTAVSADAVELARPDNSTVRLEKKDGRWVLPALGGAPANAGGVERMLDALVELRGELRSRDPAVLGDYELLDDQAMRVALWRSGREEARLLFGKGDFRNVFVRAAGSPDVHVAPGSILGQMGAYGPQLSPQFWIDGTLLAFKADDVRELRLHAPGIQAVLSRRQDAGGNATNGTLSDGWDFSQHEGKGLGRERMEGVLAVLERVPVTEVVFPAETGPSFPTHRLEIRTDAGVTVLEGAREGEAFLIRVAGSPHLYRMAGSVSARLFPAPDGGSE
jgi:hypothetical protein